MDGLKIRVRLFPMLGSPCCLHVDLTSGATAAHLVCHLKTICPDLAVDIDQSAILVNGKRAPGDFMNMVLKDSDVVSFVPNIAGG